MIIYNLEYLYLILTIMYKDHMAQENMTGFLLQTQENKDEMEKIMWEHHAKYRVAKIELESLIQELQKELEKLKAVCIINSEKIGYNYQVIIITFII